ncbi:MAG: hypothetical protein K0M55_06940 [Rhizobium sp.]|nr:hypothetical protein [Rhizobium sp.]
MSQQFVVGEVVRYWWPVIVRIPDPEKAGQVLERKFEILFEPEDQDTAVETQLEYSAIASLKDRIEHERQQLLRVAKDWKGVLDKNRQPVLFSEENFRAALQQSWFRIGVNTALAESLAGQARLGN